MSSKSNIFVCLIMSILKKVKSHSDVLDYFKGLLFYNKYIEKPNTKHLKSISLLSELTFYEELNITKTDHAFKGHAMSH